MQKLTHNGSDGRTYGGDPSLIHIPDHHRADFGRAIADTVTSTMRLLGTLGVGHDIEPYDGDKALCPGCYMIGLFDALVELAKRDGQSVQELGASMAELFTQLAVNGEYRPTEEMIVRDRLPGVSFNSDPVSGHGGDLDFSQEATFSP